MNGFKEKRAGGLIWGKVACIVLAYLITIGVFFVAGLSSADTAYAATGYATSNSLKAGSVSSSATNIMPNFNFAFKGQTRYYGGYFYCYDSNGYLRRNVIVKYGNNYIIWYQSSGRGVKLRNREVKFKNNFYQCGSDGNLVKGWYNHRFYSTSDCHRLSGAYKIWHSKTAYNRYYFNPSDGVRKLDFAYHGYYYRATDGVGIAFGSSEYNYLIFKELNNQRLIRGMSALWWSGGSQYNGYVLGCANMAMISFNDYMNCRAHANTKRMNNVFSWRSEYQDYMCWSQFSCCTPRAIVNTWARTTGYYSPFAYRWTHVGIHTIYKNGRYYYTLELEHNKTIR